MTKRRVPLYKTSPVQSVMIDPDATVGAQVGVNLLDPAGKLIPAATWNSLVNPQAEADPNGGTLLWRFLREVPAPVKALAALTTGAGLFAVTGSGTGAYRTMTGTANRVTVTNGNAVAGNPTFDIASTYIGQASITTLGTITTGTWAGTAIGATHGGTGLTTYAAGDILYASAANTLAKLAKGTDTQVLTLSDGLPVWADAAGTFLLLTDTPDAYTDQAGKVPRVNTAEDALEFTDAIESVGAGTGMSVDTTDPKNPVVSSTLGSIALTGREQTYADLPSTGLTSGDAYYVESDGLIYIWDGTAFPAEGQGAWTGYGRGTSFPFSPATGMRWDRTDLNLLCYFDGTRWLTVQEYSAACVEPDSTNIPLASVSLTLPAPGADIYVTTCSWTVRVPGTNNASSYWTLTVSSNDGASNTALATFSTQSQSFASPNIFVVYSVDVNSVMSGARAFGAAFTKIGSPGGCYRMLVLKYRLIVT